MKVEASSGDFKIVATRREVRIIKDCILNLTNFTEDGEFNTYTGATKEEAKAIMNACVLALKENPI